MTRLLTRKASDIATIHLARILLSGIATTGTKPSGENSGYLAPYPGTSKNENLVMMFSYACGGYLMVKNTPSPDVGDDDDGGHTRS
jgi:hypothetical protein